MERQIVKDSQTAMEEVRCDRQLDNTGLSETEIEEVRNSSNQKLLGRTSSQVSMCMSDYVLGHPK
jgi:hypothetical protein